MRKTLFFIAYEVVMVSILFLGTWLFTDETWQQGLSDGAIGLICSTFLGIVLIWWVPKKRREWGLDEDPKDKADAD